MAAHYDPQRMILAVIPAAVGECRHVSARGSIRIAVTRTRRPMDPRVRGDDKLNR